MDDSTFWCLAFISIASFRFHPKNVEVEDRVCEDELREIDFAAQLADYMLEKKRREK